MKLDETLETLMAKTTFLNSDETRGPYEISMKLDETRFGLIFGAPGLIFGANWSPGLIFGLRG